MAVSKPDVPHVAVLIVGAGISGIDAAYRLKTRCPSKTWLILEARDRIGGTWDLFRFPGVRSDSDMYTLSFPFRPWRSDQAIVDGPSIRQYVEDTARECGIVERIRFGRKVVSARWSSADKGWMVEAEHDGRLERFTCAFLYFASGYYDYARGYRPAWPGEESFEGRIVHPQFWPDELDYAGKRVAVIGSGATAVTLIPPLTEKAAHVTMVQRSPSYIVSRPGKDAVAAVLRRLLPDALAHSLIRWKNLLFTMLIFNRARRRPEEFSQWVTEQLRKQLPAGYPVERDFSPAYKPWDQRLCLVPDGDLFAAMREGKVSIATGSIERFTPGGLRLESGKDIAADIIVAATGLNMKLLGGVEISLDGKPVKTSELLIYKGMMLSDVPNLFIAFGYTNASWTLRSDLTARSVCRLLNRMDRAGKTICVARATAEIEPRPVMDLTSGYVKRAEAMLPKQGDREPWRVPQNYVRDLIGMTFGRIDEAIDFA